MICENCFGDGFLAEHIQNVAIKIIESCEYCGSENTKAMLELELVDIIFPVLGLYVESDSEDSEPILNYLRRDWGLLKKLEDSYANKLLDAIFLEENVSGKKFSSKQSQNARLELWKDFQNELKHKNRFFPQTKIIDQEILKDLFSFLIFKDPPGVFYRARVCEGDDCYNAEEMHRPPEKLAKAGRANPSGISYLYTASDIETSIAEIRPNVGDHVSVAEFSTLDALTLLDLRNPRETVSPFAINSEDLLNLLNELEFLCKLGTQLSKTILPREAELEYLASQYLCEMIKHFGYDGVVYKSSVGSGFNIAFFNDSKVTIHSRTKIIKHHVKTVKYDSNLVQY